MATILGNPTKHETVESQYSITVPTIKNAGNPDPYLGNIETGGYNFSIKAQHMLNDNIHLEASASALETNYNNVALTERGRIEPFYMDFVNEDYYVEGGYGWHRRNKGWRIMGSFTATYFLNSHLFFHLSYTSVKSHWPYPWLGYFPDLCIRKTDSLR